MFLEENGEDKIEKLTDEQVFERIGEKRTLQNNILRRKVNWIGHILRRNCLLHDAIEGQITGVKAVGRSSFMIWETEEDIGSYRRKLKIEIDWNDSLSIEHKEEIIFSCENFVALLYMAQRSGH